MGRKHVAKYVKRIDAHLKRHRKHVYKIFKKMARHPGCYKKTAGMMLYGAGVKGKKKAGMMLYGAGVKGKKKAGMMLFGAGVRRKKRKLPAWVTKPVPKSGWPSAPAGMTKKASGWYARQKAKAKALHAKAKAKAKKVWDNGKKIVTGVADHVANKVFESANGLVDEVGDAVDDHIDRMGSESQKYLDEKVDDYSGRASKYVSKAGKRGSGRFKDLEKKNLQRSIAQNKGIYRDTLGYQRRLPSSKRGSGTFSRRTALKIAAQGKKGYPSMDKAMKARNRKAAANW